MSETRVGRRLAALALAILLGGCSSAGGDRPESAVTSSPDPASTAAPDGTAVSDAMSAASAAALAESRMGFAAEQPPPETIGAPAVRVAATADTAADPSIIEVQFSGARLPDTVWLVTPDGVEIEPLSIDEVAANAPLVDDSRNFRAGLSGSSFTGLKAKFAIGFPFGGIEPVDRQSPVHTLVRFKVPDLQHYVQHWTNYRIVILHAPGTEEEVRLETMPPQPDVPLQ